MILHRGDIIHLHFWHGENEDRNVIAKTLMSADLSDPVTWQSIPAMPTRLCSWCPWHRRDFKVANEKGCPGK